MMVVMIPTIDLKPQLSVSLFTTSEAVSHAKFQRAKHTRKKICRPPQAPNKNSNLAPKPYIRSIWWSYGHQLELGSIDKLTVISKQVNSEIAPLTVSIEFFY